MKISHLLPLCSSVKVVFESLENYTGRLFTQCLLKPDYNPKSQGTTYGSLIRTGLMNFVQTNAQKNQDKDQDVVLGQVSDNLLKSLDQFLQADNYLVFLELYKCMQQS